MCVGCCVGCLGHRITHTAVHSLKFVCELHIQSAHSAVNNIPHTHIGILDVWIHPKISIMYILSSRCSAAYRAIHRGNGSGMHTSERTYLHRYIHSYICTYVDTYVCMYIRSFPNMKPFFNSN